MDRQRRQRNQPLGDGRRGAAAVEGVNDQISSVGQQFDQTMRDFRWKRRWVLPTEFLVDQRGHADNDRARQAALAGKVFELSQGLEQQWLISKYAEKREILNLVFLNFRLDGASLVAEMNKPFDMLAEGLIVSSSRADRI